MLGKLAGPPPKKKPYTGRTISLFLTWTLAEFWFIVSLIPEITVGKLVVLFFYVSFTTFLLAYLILQGFARKMREQVVELLSIDLSESVLPLAMGGIAASVLLIPVVIARGATFHPLDVKVIIEQLLVVAPNETFIFLFFLPHLLPAKALRVPGWLWAQVLFATFHYVAYAANPFGMFFAFTIGVVWWQVKEAGSVYSFLGLPFVFSFHFMWNIVTMAASGSTSGSVADALWIFFPVGMVLAGLPWIFAPERHRNGVPGAEWEALRAARRAAGARGGSDAAEPGRRLAKRARGLLVALRAYCGAFLVPDASRGGRLSQHPLDGAFPWVLGSGPPRATSE